MKHGKQTAFCKKGKSIEDPSCYPVSLQCEGDFNCKISVVGYDSKRGFIMTFNDRKYYDMQYKSKVYGSGPQNITQGAIVMNEETKVLDGFISYEQFKAELPKQALLTDLLIQRFSSTSADVVNQMFDDCSRIIHEVRGLEKIEIRFFRDKNQLQAWPLAKITSKALLLHTLKISHLYGTTAENRSTIMDFCTEVC